MNIGIDKIAFHIPKYYMDIVDFAKARNVESDKFTIGLGQKNMSVNDRSQDIVTLGAIAASKILTKEDKEQIDMVIVGTETGIDQSKAAAVYIKSLLNINDYTRCIEIKQACYGATAALWYAISHISLNPESKVLVVASDIAKYGLNTAGESTQGAGAVAMLISKDPKILNVKNNYVSCTNDVMDFYRPNDSIYALVDGKLSKDMYLDCLNKVYTKYIQKYGKKEYSAMLFHIPYPKLGKKGLDMIEGNNEKLSENFEKSILYNSNIGNLYTGSLFLSLISLLENADLNENENIALYSYGSGAVAEFFEASLVKDYKKHLLKDMHISMLNNREKISVKEYEKMFFENLDKDVEYKNISNEKIYLSGIFDNKRKYVSDINE